MLQVALVGRGTAPVWDAGSRSPLQVMGSDCGWKGSRMGTAPLCVPGSPEVCDAAAGAASDSLVTAGGCGEQHVPSSDAFSPTISQGEQGLLLCFDPGCRYFSAT